MGKRFFPFTFALVALFAPNRAEARDCPTTCSGYLWQIGDTLELGAEFRLFYFGAGVGEDMPTSRRDGERHFEHNIFMAMRPLLYWYPVDGLTIAIEHEARFRWPGWQENAVPGTDFAIAGFDHRPTVLFLEYETHGFAMTWGLQPFAFGSGAVLDQRFMGLALEYDHENFNVSAFGGLTMRNFMRNAAHSMWMSYTSATNGWKFTSNNPAENWGVGMTFSIKNVRPFRLRFLYLYSNPSYDHLESHAYSLHFSGPLWRPYLSFVLEPVFLMHPEEQLLPGVVAEIRARFGRTATSPQLLVGGASSFLNDEDRHMSSVFENLSYGLIRRFNLFQGHIVRTRFSWQVIDYVRVYADYVVAFPHDGLTDELDVGLWMQLNDLYRLNLAYVGINLAGEAQASHAIYAEARIVIGPQP